MNGTLSLIIYLLDIKDYTPLLLIWLIDYIFYGKQTRKTQKVSLEQEVLARLKKTFPSIQFIVSTHSPMVLSNLKVKDTGNMIYRMQADEDTPNALPNLYGVDYSAAVYDFMGTPYADNEVKEEIEAILRLSRRGKPELVEKRKEELKSMVSEEQYINIISKINSQLAEDKY